MFVWGERGRTWVYARAGGDEDDVAVSRGRNQLLYGERALQLNSGVVGGLPEQNAAQKPKEPIVVGGSE